jgi:hypothetical protein
VFQSAIAAVTKFKPLGVYSRNGKNRALSLIHLFVKG